MSNINNLCKLNKEELLNHIIHKAGLALDGEDELEEMLDGIDEAIYVLRNCSYAGSEE